MNRKTAPDVKKGRVQKKNNWTPTSGYYNSGEALPLIDRGRPGAGYRHLLKRRAIQLLPVLLHDVGNHHDHMTTRPRRSAARGEWFAENYASQYEAQVWNDYLRSFGLD